MGDNLNSCFDPLERCIPTHILPLRLDYVKMNRMVDPMYSYDNLKPDLPRKQQSHFVFYGWYFE